MKGSTAGAVHLAQSKIWMAWWMRDGLPWPFGTLMEAALAHWDGDRFGAFLDWRRNLRNGRTAQ
jgi:hypothetical protein